MNARDLASSIDTDSLCQECASPWTYAIVRPVVDAFYCDIHAVARMRAANIDQRNYDAASALAALDAMVLEGSAYTP